jgi:nucleoside-diphosphate-sugar epimerase
MKVLVTGANGLVGSALCDALDQSGAEVVRGVRSSTQPLETSLGDLSEYTNWEQVLTSDIDVVVHLAAHVPLLDATAEWEAARCAEVNTKASAHLMRQCVLHGIKRFVFVSTVKVLGEGKSDPYRETDSAAPADAYATSKWNAEQLIWQMADATGIEAVVLRPPLVYGPKVKGNFFRLVQAIDQRRPLPLACIENLRSLVYLGNLVDAIRLCLTHPHAPGKTFMVSDGDDVSTPELVRRIAAALGRRPFLLPLPVWCIRWAGAILGKQAAVERLLGSLRLDISSLKKTLGWTPPYTMQMGLVATADWYRKTKATS